MTLVAFTLSMPVVKSWDGKWSGQESVYAKVLNLRSPEASKALSKNYYTWRFSDGWVAAVSTEQVDAKKAASLRKRTRGFCGYDWMVDSIIKNGEIKDNE